MHSVYTLKLFRDTKKTQLCLTANDVGHAIGQASDICRALEIDKFDLQYTSTAETVLSKLFKKLCFNEFCNNDCVMWEGAQTNKTPCVYLLGRRYYVRHVILKYMDIPTDNFTTKLRCRCANCINPYHFEYLPSKNAKLSCGDTKLLLAYRSQGTGVNQIAEAFNVHRSTIYRKLKNERVSAGSANHRNGSRK